MISHFTKINVKGHKDKFSTIREKKYLTSVIRLELFAVTAKLIAYTVYIFITFWILKFTHVKLVKFEKH